MCNIENIAWFPGTPGAPYSARPRRDAASLRTGRRRGRGSCTGSSAPPAPQLQRHRRGEFSTLQSAVIPGWQAGAPGPRRSEAGQFPAATPVPRCLPSASCNRSVVPCWFGRSEEINAPECAEIRRLGQRHTLQAGQLHGPPERLPHHHGTSKRYYQRASRRRSRSCCRSSIRSSLCT